MSNLLDGKVAMITGACVGIGRACAIRFGELGAKLVLLDYNAETLAALKEELKAYHAEDALTFTCDVGDEAAVQAAKQHKAAHTPHACPGSAPRTFGGCPGSMAKALHPQDAESAAAPEAAPSQLRQWPVQIKLVPTNAPYFDGAKLLIAADCTAYAYAAFHQRFIRGHITLVGCPKLDDVDYSEKLTKIIRDNDIKEVTVVRMEVPCCGGLENAAKRALQASGKFLPWQVVTISTDGRILD